MDKYTNIILTMIFALLLIDMVNFNIIQEANASVDSSDIRDIVRALEGIKIAIQFKCCPVFKPFWTEI